MSQSQPLKVQHYFILFIVIFGLSGFSGLIYQSIWTHYLKLYLGHAAYAQVLVLSIFMGGMAVGAALAARYSHKLTNLILFYGIAEGLIGVFGLIFHQVFVGVQAVSYDSIFPALSSPAAVQTVKWSFAALLILPQSILLGATFPFLSAGLLRKFNSGNTQATGKTLATLYFVNSFGASIGILCNAFFIIPKVGLPGSLLTAGLINVFLALLVYRLSKHDHYPETALVSQSDVRVTHSSLLTRMLVFSSLTGLASFMYEIGWIRMLTMVLGGSTHSFEIMLSAFILGLALGSLWIRPRIDQFRQPIAVLGLIQVVMGLLAALTIPLYNWSFEVMGFAMNALNKTAEGYVAYSLFSYGISLLIMLPTAFCAGTTLPLATHILLKTGHKDSAIGQVYAWNTIGGIIGVVIAAQIVMPIFGLKWVIMGGALVDLALGLVLIYVWKDSQQKSAATISIPSTVLVIGFVILLMGSQLDTQKMASGVFRYGIDDKNDEEILFHKDGKTSTVAVKKQATSITILNNGKPDAGIMMEPHGGRTYGSDEPTMVLLGSLAYSYRPESKLIANIGFGSGLTAHTILHAPTLQQLDTIEIEKAVIEGARLYGDKVRKAYEDDRHTVIIDDAKTFFAAQQKQYDVIVSEPPNPWVAGVSSLFSEEFYKHVNQYLRNDGVLVQWMHLYEISPNLVATVFSALRKEFRHVHFYQISEADIAIIASSHELREDHAHLFTMEDMKTELNRISIYTPEDIAARKLAETEVLDLFFKPLEQNANSDFFPILDNGAAKQRFLSASATQLFQLYDAQVLKKLLNLPENHFGSGVSTANEVQKTHQIQQIHAFYGLLKNADIRVNDLTLLELIPTEKNQALLAKSILKLCHQQHDEGQKQHNTHILTSIVTWLFPNSQQTVLAEFVASFKPCSGALTAAGLTWLDIMQAWLNNDFDTVVQLGAEYLETREIANDKDFLIAKLYLGSVIKTNRTDQLETVNRIVNKIPPMASQDFEYVALKEIVMP